MIFAFGTTWLSNPKRFVSGSSVRQIYPGRVATGPVKARDQSGFHRIAADSENNRYSRSRRLRGKCGGFAAGRDQNCNLLVDESGRHGRETIILPFGPTVLEFDVLPGDEAGGLQTLFERCDQVLRFVGRPGAQKSDHRRRLLGASCQRPSRSRTTNEGDERAPSHDLPQGIRTERSVRLKLTHYGQSGQRTTQGRSIIPAEHPGPASPEETQPIAACARPR